MSTPFLAIPELVENQSAAEIVVNEQIIALEALGGAIRVEDRDLAAPPAHVHGNVWIVANSPTGLWAGQAGKLALSYNGAWKFYTRKDGMAFWIKDEDKLFLYDGTNYIKVAENQKVKYLRTIQIVSPTATEHRHLYYTDVAITLKRLSSIVRGPTSPSLTWNVYHGTDYSAAGTAVLAADQATTNTTTGQINTSFSSAAILANSFVWFKSSAVSATAPTEFGLTVMFTQDD